MQYNVPTSVRTLIATCGRGKVLTINGTVTTFSGIFDLVLTDAFTVPSPCSRTAVESPNCAAFTHKWRGPARLIVF